MTAFLDDPVPGAPATVLLAHGAGAPMDSAAMSRLTAALVRAGLAVRRFEFDYMAARREGGRRPPPKAEALVPAYLAAIERTLVATDGPLVVAGKSLGGRVATMAAAEPLDARVKAVAVFGYPFHPPDAPTNLRLAPLLAARLPVLVAQGTRDPFGGPDEVTGYGLPDHVRVDWYPDGDHDLAPRKASGATAEGHAAAAAAALRALVERLQ